MNRGTGNGHRQRYGVYVKRMRNAHVGYYVDKTNSLFLTWTRASGSCAAKQGECSRDERVFRSMEFFVA